MPAPKDAKAPKAAKAKAAEGAPVNVVDMDEQIKEQAAGEPVEGVSFWFGHIHLYKFKDGSSYHATKQRALITDQKLIDNLTEASKNPSNYIFIEA